MMILLKANLFQRNLEFDLRNDEANPAASSIRFPAQFKTFARVATVFEGEAIAALSAAAPADTRCRSGTTRTRSFDFVVFAFQTRISLCFQ
jgi:hypothetical protein